MSQLIPSSIPSSPASPVRCAVLGCGFAGLSVAWHLMKNSPRELRLRVDLFDEAGIGGGASGVSGGLLHPYSPKGKLLWRGAECWKETLRLLNVAEMAALYSKDSNQASDGPIVRRRGILRPAVNLKNSEIMTENAQNCHPNCRIETIGEDYAQTLVPNICAPHNLAFYMPAAVNVYPLPYLQALFLACQNIVKENDVGQKELYLHKKSIHKLLDLEGEYDAVIICLGAKVDMLPELSGRLPLRTCRGVVVHMHLPLDMREDYPEHAPSILSDAWLAIQGTRSLYMGSTWEWKSTNSSTRVTADEASKALENLLPKASVFYPGIKNWSFGGAKAGLRAMPPLTPHGSLPLLGCVNNLVGQNCSSKYWLFGGLGSRGLLYHAWLGKLMAEAVLSCDEQLIPSELIAWKNIKR